MVDTSKMRWKDTGPEEERKQFIEDWLAAIQAALKGAKG